jgi:ATP-dependent DNA helicase RecG
VLNAVSHRNYQLSGSVFIRQYNDRLVIESPGGFPNGVTLENILDRQSPRNRLIAEILALCGLVERAGQGMNLIYECSVKEAKALPDFKGTDDYYVFMTLNGLIIDKQMLSVLSKIGDERLEQFVTEDFLVIDELFRREKIPAKFHSRIHPLLDMGIIETSGRNKYVLARSLYAVTGKAGVYTRNVGLDRETNKALLLKHIRDSGKDGAPLKELQQVLPSHSRKQVQLLLASLREEDRIKLDGKTNGARWFVVSK